MPLKLKKVSKYINKLIKTKKSFEFPKYNLTGQSSFYFGLLCGVRGAGKTNAMLQILNIEKEHLLSRESIVHWVSPTHDSKVAEYAERFPDNMIFYDELNMKTFNQIIQSINDGIEEWNQTKYIFDLFEKYLKKEDDVDEGELNILMESGILEDDADVAKMIKDFNFHHPPRSTICLDDSMGSPIISSSNSKQGKEAVRWFIRHRHSYCNVFIMSQHFRAISKPIRSNTNMVLLFPSKDRSVLKSIFDEFSPLFKGKMENYEEALDLLDNHAHNFLLMFYDQVKFLRFGFDKKIEFDE